MAEQFNQLGLGAGIQDPIDDHEPAAASHQQTAAEQKHAETDAACQREFLAPMPPVLPPREPLAGSNQQHR